jgi:hypothetical protein
MPAHHELQEILDRVKQEVEQAVYYPSQWAAEHVKREIVDAVGKDIEDKFDELVERSVRKASTQAFEREVVRMIDRGMQPIREEFARFRRAFEHDQDEADWWKRGWDEDADEFED